MVKYTNGLPKDWLSWSRKRIRLLRNATISRAAPARIHGFQDRGALTPGYNADIAVYDINPNDFDSIPKTLKVYEKAFSNAYYTIKDGQIVVKDGDIVSTKQSHTIWTNVIGYEEEEKQLSTV
jgi:Formylmethanofuran dehydrogenase subunit A